MAQERPQSPVTLADVLYAKSKAPVSEQRWAKLVRSIAAGDQLALHALVCATSHQDPHPKPENVTPISRLLIMDLFAGRLGRSRLK